MEGSSSIFNVLFTWLEGGGREGLLLSRELFVIETSLPLNLDVFMLRL